MIYKRLYIDVDEETADRLDRVLSQKGDVFGLRAHLLRTALKLVLCLIEGDDRGAKRIEEHLEEYKIEYA